jgi:sugar phosphate isomerase/epimerase
MGKYDMGQQSPANINRHQEIIRRIQVNIPFTMLVQKNWLDLFLELKLNPEIGLDSEALDNFSAKDFEQIARHFKDCGCSITLHAPFLDLSPGSPDPKIREATRYRYNQLLDAIPIFKPISIVCHSGYDDDRYSFCKEAWMENCIETLKWLGDEIHHRGARMMLENVYETHPDDLLAVIKHLNPIHTRCCLDIGHLTVFGKSPLDQWLSVLGPHIGQFHLHDNHGTRDNHIGLGEGCIDFKTVFDFISSMQPPPIITLEPHKKEDFAASLNFLEQCRF